MERIYPKNVFFSVQTGTLNRNADVAAYLYAWSCADCDLQGRTGDYCEEFINPCALTADERAVYNVNDSSTYRCLNGGFCIPIYNTQGDNETANFRCEYICAIVLLNFAMGFSSTIDNCHRRNKTLFQLPNWL